MFAKVHSMGLLGVDGFLIQVEADLSPGGFPASTWWACQARRCGNPGTGCAPR